MDALVTLSLPIEITKAVRERLAKLEEANAKQIAMWADRLRTSEDPKVIELSTEGWFHVKARAKKITYANVLRILIETGLKEYARGAPNEQLDRFDKAGLPARGRPRGGDERGS